MGDKNKNNEFDGITWQEDNLVDTELTSEHASHPIIRYFVIVSRYNTTTHDLRFMEHEVKSDGYPSRKNITEWSKKYLKREGIPFLNESIEMVSIQELPKKDLQEYKGKD